MTIPVTQQDCLAGIALAVNSVFARLEQVEQDVRGIFQQKISAQQPVTSKDLKALRPLLARLLENQNDALQGIGVVLEPGVLDDSDMYIEWRQINANGRITSLDLNFNRSSESYYNYLEMSWFAQPRSKGECAIAGPYVDLYGQDMYILTFALPIHIQGRFIGVAGADVALVRFESILLQALMPLPQEAVLVSEQGRVIAANNSNYVTGELVRQALTAAEIECQTIELGYTGVHWSLLQYPAPSGGAFSAT